MILNYYSWTLTPKFELSSSILQRIGRKTSATCLSACGGNSIFGTSVGTIPSDKIAKLHGSVMFEKESFRGICTLRTFIARFWAVVH